ncbi:MAG: cupin domain-containing protein [Methyloceanibacter sp.]
MARAAKQEALPEEDWEAIPDEPLQSGIEAYVLADDGLIPNNAKLPLVLYRQAPALERLSGAPEHAFEALFRSNGWRGAWVDGIYDFHHYHSTAHEVLGIAKGSARVQFGGPEGLVVDLTAGDVVVIPAGVGHCLIEGEDLVVVGAYPEGQDWDLCRASASDHAKALDNIPWVPLPKLDPVFGPAGPVLVLWID